MENVLQQLENLKGVFLLRPTGTIYIISDFTIERKIKKTWFSNKEIVLITNIKSGKLSVDVVPAGRPELVLQNLTTDRMRYLKMISSLKNYKCTIVSYDKLKTIKHMKTNDS